MAKVKKKILSKTHLQKEAEPLMMPLARFRSVIIMVDGFRAAVHNVLNDELKSRYEPKGGELTDAMKVLEATAIKTLEQVRKNMKRLYKTEV